MKRVCIRTAALSLLFTGISLPCLALATPATATMPFDPLAFGTVNPELTPVRPVEGSRGMVVSAQHLASEAGRQILASGGNAADAAVAVGYALAVVYPAAGNIGGGGFMTLRLPDGKTTFIDFRERAPGAATPTMYQDGQGKVDPKASIEGWRAVGIPGTVAGLEEIHRRWGKLSRAKVMAPAIALAEKGFVLGQGDADLLHTSTEAFRKDSHARAIFLRADGTPLQKGDRLVQKVLARTLRSIAQSGADIFYKGAIAQQVVAASEKNGGILTLADFAAYHHANSPRFTVLSRV